MFRHLSDNSKFLSLCLKEVKSAISYVFSEGREVKVRELYNNMMFYSPLFSPIILLCLSLCSFSPAFLSYLAIVLDIEQIFP